MNNTTIMPDMGENLTSGTITQVFVSPGDNVDIGTPLIEVEADKTLVEIPSDATGIIEEIMVSAGDRITAGDRIAVVATQPSPHRNHNKQSQPSAARFNELQKRKDQPKKITTSGQSQTSAESVPSRGTCYAGPSAHRLARELGINLDRVASLSTDQRISTADIKNYVRKKLSETAGTDIAPQPLRGDHQLFSHQLKADITRLEADRSRINQPSQPHSISLESFLIRAIGQILRKNPLTAATEEPARESRADLTVVLRNSLDFGYSVIKQVDQLPLHELENRLQQDHGTTSHWPPPSLPHEPQVIYSNLSQAEREQLFSGTPRKSAIFITTDEPFIEKEDQRATQNKKTALNLTLFCDQTLVSGFEATEFLEKLKRLLENPVLLALQ
ncbi:MAG: hypothetical protein JXQ81_00800 [Desulfuromonadales bacterium]|nr:hypothetical protein [Desulfuromonadales bacterium]MBN2791023.1 hypothetical protein [Desulfuromonadales bacterium]